jgi:hypothetical protein
MRVLLCIGALTLGSCVATEDHATLSMSDGSVVHTIRCEDSWDACYLAAGRICGEAGFEEVARDMESALSSAGRLERMHTVEGGIDQQRYSENTREQAYSRAITVRCGTKR